MDHAFHCLMINVVWYNYKLGEVGEDQAQVFSNIPAANRLQ